MAGGVKETELRIVDFGLRIAGAAFVAPQIRIPQSEIRSDLLMARSCGS